MAKQPEPAGAKATAQAKPEIHIIGLTKVGPARYAVVTGTTDKPVVDTVSQPLEYAAEAMKVAVLRLVQVIP